MGILGVPTGPPSSVPLQPPTPPALGGFLSRVLPQRWSWQSTQSSRCGWQQEDPCSLPGVGSGTSSVGLGCRQHLCSAGGAGGETSSFGNRCGVSLHPYAVVWM